MLIDTHCHLDAREFDADRDDLMRCAESAGIVAIVVPAIERANFGAVASICRDYAGCAPAYGIHPMYVDQALPEDLDVLRATLMREPAVAVGEIGLDRHVSPRDDERQLYYFRAQLSIARELSLPVLLHVRRAIDPILHELRRIQPPGGIAHAFNGSLEQAREFTRLGFKLGLGGAVTHERAQKLRALAKALPRDAIVLETDAPDIPPAWRTHKRTEPADLLPIAETLAKLRGEPLTDFCAATSANALSVLPRLATFINPFS
ncbi:MAG: TatD family hydrolase [Rhodocyclaceae bacterium]|nr:TatD family hydrolase [Rhodocyclaceae bacterium]